MSNVKSRNFYLALITSLSLLLYISSLVVTQKDVDFSNRWISFALWIGSISIPLSPLVTRGIVKIKDALRDHSLKEFLPFIAITILAIGTRFFLLDTYPFAAVGDEVRDGGLNAQEIAQGTLKNIFGYGRYEAHGLIIPIITSFLYSIFDGSVLTYRVPAAMISILDILIIFILVNKVLGKTPAFFASLLLTNFPIHMFYSRTEIVVISSSLLTSAILLVFYLFLTRKNLEYAILLGITLGFATAFHASVRTIVLLFVIITVLIITISAIKERSFKNSLILLSLLIIFYFVGLGPRLLFTTPQIFFHATTVPILKEQKTVTFAQTFKNIFKEGEIIATNYTKSLKTYINEPVSYHYQYEKPFLPPFLVPFFLAGFLYSLFSHHKLLKVIALLTLVVPFTNSAITDCTNCTHRLAPVLPVIAITTAIGIWVSLSVIKNLPLKNFLITGAIASIALSILSLGHSFFSEESASKGKERSDFMSMYVINLLKTSLTQNAICLGLSPKTYDHFNLPHLNEQYEYFLPGKTITKIKHPAGDNEVYIYQNCDSQKVPLVKYELCYTHTKFICPLGKDGGINIYVQESLWNN